MVSVLRDSIKIIDCESEYVAVSKSDAIVVILDFACGFTLNNPNKCSGYEIHKWFFEYQFWILSGLEKVEQ